MKFFIHSGFPKAGSSLIQESLYLNRKKLLDIGWQAYTYHNLESEQFFQTARDIMFDRIELDSIDYDALSNTIAKDKNIIVSFEDLFFVPNNIFKKKDIFYNTDKIAIYFKKLASAVGAKLELLFYIRDKESWLESYYVQTIHKGRSWGYLEFIKQCDTNSFSLDKLTAVMKEVGLEYSFKDFSTIKLGQDTFLQHFYDKAGISLEDGIKVTKRINTSYSHQAIEIARVANKVLTNQKDKDKLRVFLQNNFSTETHIKFSSVDQ
ncbi:hypothetical protein H2O77_10950 [Cobetia sp. 4B]|uniref:hypothetical protein n=1 Tax=Cobetia sp. 4B TaxID=2758724 RepID=UPI001C04C755|nr:hypothetical protein [Cobetia sp. 4B]QWN35826.1 hypothetical protein H2O77_10950 [Cobetia sp. 4B]